MHDLPLRREARAQCLPDFSPTPPQIAMEITLSVGPWLIHLARWRRFDRLPLSLAKILKCTDGVDSAKLKACAALLLHAWRVQ